MVMQKLFILPKVNEWRQSIFGGEQMKSFLESL